MKGQTAAIDLILSTLVLSLLAFGIIAFLDAELKNSESAYMDLKRDWLAQSAAYMLANSAGNPENWNETSCESPGLSCGQGVLCPWKLSLLESLYSSDYNQTRELLNLLGYGTSILVCNPSDYSECDYNMSTQAGEDDRLSSHHVSRGEILSTLNGRTVSVIVYAWE